MYQFSRNLLSYGKEGQNILYHKSVAILGLGGVGSYSCESIARSGVGKIILIDKDKVDITNINRQLHATLETVGQSKVALMVDRIQSINPKCHVVKHEKFFNFDTYDEIFNEEIDFFIDASDTITFKILLIKECLERNIPFISVMGTANKLDPSQFEISDIKNTSYDPIAKVIRTKLRKEGIKGKVPVVYSKEKPITSRYDEYDGDVSKITRKSQFPPASNSFVPPVAGLIATSYVIRNLLKEISFERDGES
ncbi:tRNA threonylcarbamoyladenosine dehydratase [Mycoplasmatota bacterium]|nr:tRNA threonylcarbamoyladenosine dehydratase [Mycoplasmatota bacterium]